jgi:hypothetical protein
VIDATGKKQPQRTRHTANVDPPHDARRKSFTLVAKYVSARPDPIVALQLRDRLEGLPAAQAIHAEVRV